MFKVTPYHVNHNVLCTGGIALSLLVVIVHIDISQSVAIVSFCQDDGMGFRCYEGGQCFPISSLCNGVNDCPANIDEGTICTANDAIPDAPCNALLCSGFGLCNRMDEGFNCQCLTGFSGTQCEYGNSSSIPQPRIDEITDSSFQLTWSEPPLAFGDLNIDRYRVNTWSQNQAPIMNEVAIGGTLTVVDLTPATQYFVETNYVIRPSGTAEHWVDISLPAMSLTTHAVPVESTTVTMVTASTTTVNEVHPCDDNQFSCDDGHCIKLSWVCDDIIDCIDGRDEAFCDGCSQFDFNCNNGQCIDPALVCNGQIDCGNHRDELGCPAPTTEKTISVEPTTSQAPTTERTTSVEHTTSQEPTTERTTSVEPTTSQEILCDALTIPTNGFAYPLPTCVGAVTVGTDCYLGCKRGYTLSTTIIGAGTLAPLYCRQSGTKGVWSADSRNVACQLEDTTPPRFMTSCPYEVTALIRRPCAWETIVSFYLPMPTDDSDVTVTPPSVPFSEILDIGIHERVFTSTDVYGNTAECTIIISVEAISCGAPLQPRGPGRIDSTNCLETSYECDAGYRLLGESQVVCGNDGRWNGSAPVCEKIHCDALTIPTNGFVYPHSNCTGAVPVGTDCYLGCNEGYVLSTTVRGAGTVAHLKCTQIATNGAWTADSRNVMCQDDTAPEFQTCPQSENIVLPTNSNSVSVTWPIPTASHRGQDVEAVHSGGLTPPVTLGPGEHQMEYVALSAAGKEGYCMFTIKVSDTEPPVVTTCPEPIVVVTSTLPVIHTWAEPSFSDNVGVTDIQSNIGNGFTSYDWNPVTVTYTAVDEAGNSAQCVFVVKATNSSQCDCPTLQDALENSNLQCVGTGCVSCTITCNDGYATLNRSPEKVDCSKTGIIYGKNADPNPYLQPCTTVNNTNSINVSKSYEVVLTGFDCDDEIKNGIHTRVLKNAEDVVMPIAAEDNNTICSFNKTEVKCGVANDRSSRKRKKRQSNKEIIVKFDFHAGRSDPSDVSVIKQIMAIPAPDLVSDVTLMVNGQQQVFDVESAVSGPAQVNCDARKDAAGLKCVPCPLGTSYDLEIRGCSPCSIGTYQDQEGQLVCKQCPEGKSTVGSGAYDLSHCKASCLRGQYAYLGLQPCQPCPIGSYQPGASQRGCIPCPEGKTTSSNGAVSASECIDINECESGWTGEHCDIDVNECEASPCVHGVCQDGINQYTCLCESGWTGVDCNSNINECASSPCMHGACLDEQNHYRCICNAGWTGDKCDININECAGTPCAHGVCQDQINRYICWCSAGWGGVNCTINIDDCAIDPCVHGECQDGVNQYTCECTDGWSGDNCDTNIDECASDPCVHGQCHDGINQYTCACSVGWGGINCDSESPIIIVTDLETSKVLAGSIDGGSPQIEEIPLIGVKRPAAVDYDPVEQTVYWTDVTRNDISRASLNGANQTVIVTSLSVPDGMALDITNRQLFWTDAGSDTIEKANLDGSGRQVVINETLDEPRAIVVDSNQSRIFWTDWGANPMIERANMDGSERVALITTNLLFPNGLAVDLPVRLLYWCDAGTNRMEVSTLNGGGRRTVSLITNINIHPFDIAIYNNDLYWSDWALSQLAKVNRYTGVDATVVGPAIFTQAGGLHIYQPGSSRKRRNAPSLELRCQLGTYHDIVIQTCSPCSIGTYQDQEGQLVCKQCPEGKSTVDPGAYDLSHCKGFEDIAMRNHFKHDE